MKTKEIGVCGLAAAMALLTGCGPANAGQASDTTSKTSATQLTTNENGCVSRTFTESSVTTNGNLVTEHRRETRTNMDMDGNVLQTTTSEYAQSYSVGDTSWQLPAAIPSRPVRFPGSLFRHFPSAERNWKGFPPPSFFLKTTHLQKRCHSYHQY